MESESIVSKKARAAKLKVPPHYEGAINLISENYDKLSNGYKQVARFFTQNPNIIALELIISIAAKTKVHPSTLVVRQPAIPGSRNCRLYFKHGSPRRRPASGNASVFLMLKISRKAAALWQCRLPADGVVISAVSQACV